MRTEEMEMAPGLILGFLPSSFTLRPSCKIPIGFDGLLCLTLARVSQEIRCCACVEPGSRGVPLGRDQRRDQGRRRQLAADLDRRHALSCRGLDAARAAAVDAMV